MEYTQRIECTQDLCGHGDERIFPEQIGVLGICGQKYPVNKGPNKIGRDPQTCNIVLNLHSVSRQHAVINILNSAEYMIMDLDSANKTKVLDKTLSPYIPHPLKHGDTVQFGQIFGVFRLLEDNSDLPMTQALDIPDTPIVNRHVSKLTNLPNTIIPESPNVSDKDESFVAPSQPLNKKELKSTNINILKSSGKSTVQPVSTNQIANVYWNSSRKSISINMEFDDSTDTINNSSISLKSTKGEMIPNIHEMETQVPVSEENMNAIDNIYIADTQLCTNSLPSVVENSQKNIMNDENHPNIHKIPNQLGVKLNLFIGNKENSDILNADTRQLLNSEDKGKNTSGKTGNENFKDSLQEKSNTNLNASDEEILFEEIDREPYEKDFESQPLLLPEDFIDKTTAPPNLNQSNLRQVSIHLDDKKILTNKRLRVHSDTTTDCEDFDILLTQKIPEKLDQCQNHKQSISEKDITKSSTPHKLTNQIDSMIKNKDKIDLKNSLNMDDDSTDCEDDIIPANSNTSKFENLNRKSFEDLVATQIISSSRANEMKGSSTGLEFEEMLTQVIDEVDVQNSSNISENTKESPFEDLPTQVLEVTQKKLIEESKILPKTSPFKIPNQSVKDFRRKEITNKLKNISGEKNNVDDDDNFYQSTQDIYDVLLSQNDKPSDTAQSLNKNDQQFLPDNSIQCNDRNDKINEFVMSVSNRQVTDITGVKEQTTAKRKAMSSDSSDVESTPKKIRPISFMETELPNSQEIKKNVTLNSKTFAAEISSDSETENESETQSTPILFHKHTRRKNTKIDLTKKFEIGELPTKISTRVRKPTTKAQNSPTIKNFLVSKYVTEQEENIDKDIISENLSRLKKSKAEKMKLNDVKNINDSNNTVKADQLERCDKKLNLRLNAIESQISKPIVKNKSNNKTSNDNKRHVNNSTVKKETDNKKSIMGDKGPTELKSNKLSKESDKNIKVSENSKDSQKLERASRRADKKEKNKDILTEDKSSKKDDENTTKQFSSYETTLQRSTRNRRKVHSYSEAKEIEKVSDKTDKIKHSHQDLNIVSSPEKELRRSKRQKIAKKDSETNIDEQLKHSNTKKKHDELDSGKTSIRGRESTVYNISSESGVDSPKRKHLQKSLPEKSTTSIKNARSATNSEHDISIRVTPRQTKSHNVLFTAFTSEEIKLKLEKLGAIVVTDVMQCTVVLTIDIKRTFKLLCAIGLGRPIVGPTWVQACVDAKMIVDPWMYLIKNEAKEKLFKFNLQKTITGRRNFLKGYNLSATPSVSPCPMEIKLIVECSGGTWKEGGPKWICVSCSADRNLWPSLKRRGAVIVNTEFILGGVLRQRLDIDGNKLS
ncbi:putative leucine-rich repeat-containing protein DDB_G0290503 [Battus philenor]|uniref:putative leucine-rich repeat-containing protein DDB_G0290503 n=1 Tax=Battus philenor TaxID=42288 RepID=UPI0035D0E943